MKKLLLLIIYSLALVVPARAVEFKSMAFTLTDDSVRYITTTNLEITRDGDNLIAKSADESLTLKMADITSMQFSGKVDTAIDGITADLNGEVKVCRIDGVVIGTFSSMTEAVKNLSEGIYVITDAKGASSKLQLK